MLNIDQLIKQLEEQGEVVFKHNSTTIAIWETEQGDENVRGEEYMNYMYNLYETETFEGIYDSEEYDGGLCEGCPRDAIEMALEVIN